MWWWTVGKINAGLRVLRCVKRGDAEVQADRLLTKILKLRIFSGEPGAGPPQATTAPEGLEPAAPNLLEQVTGQFAADMQVHLVNDGRVTIPLPAWGLIVLHTSRDSPRRATHFLLRRQEKVSKEKATRLSGSFRFAPGSLRCSTPAGVGRTRFAQTTAALIPPPSALLGPAKRAWGTRTNSGRQGQGRAKAHPCRSQKGG